MASRAKLLVICLLSLTSTPADCNDCLVRTNTQLKDAASVNILSFINLNEHLEFVLEFEQLDVTYWRDWMQLVNSGVAMSMVRDGVIERAKNNLPFFIPEGWTKLRLQAVKDRFTLTLVSVDDDATLFNHTLDYPVSSVHVKGNFSLCDGESPEWEVSEGREVPVLLQPLRTQQLQMTCRGHATPYLVIPTVPPRNAFLSANASLNIVTNRQDTITLTQVSQDNEVKVGEKEQSIASSTMVMGSYGGGLHLRLNLTPLPSDVQPSRNDSRVATRDNSASPWPAGFVFFVGVIVGCLIMVLAMIIALVWRRKKPQEDPVSESEKCLEK